MLFLQADLAVGHVNQAKFQLVNICSLGKCPVTQTDQTRRAGAAPAAGAGKPAHTHAVFLAAMRSTAAA